MSITDHGALNIFHHENTKDNVTGNFYTNQTNYIIPKRKKLPEKLRRYTPTKGNQERREREKKKVKRERERKARKREKRREKEQEKGRKGDEKREKRERKEREKREKRGK